jgi:hypothetical protein
MGDFGGFGVPTKRMTGEGLRRSCRVLRIVGYVNGRQIEHTQTIKTTE